MSLESADVRSRKDKNLLLTIQSCSLVNNLRRLTFFVLICNSFDFKHRKHFLNSAIYFFNSFYTMKARNSAALNFPLIVHPNNSAFAIQASTFVSKTMLHGNLRLQDSPVEQNKEIQEKYINSEFHGNKMFLSIY